MISDYPRGMTLLEENYRAARSCNGLTRNQLDTALDDLVAADRIELVNSGGLVVARLVREAGQ
jgi:hypothetical protein